MSDYLTMIDEAFASEHSSPEPVDESLAAGEGVDSQAEAIGIPGGGNEANGDDITAVKVEPTASPWKYPGFDWVSEININGVIRHWRGGRLISEVKPREVKNHG
jgi:hypothetical protein